MDPNQVLLRTIVEGIHLGVLCIDKNARVNFANPEMIRLLGFSSEELCKMTLRDLTHPADFVDTRDKYGDAKKGEFYQAIRRYLRKDGSYIPVKLHVTRFSENKADIHGVAIVEDLSSHKSEPALLQEQQIRITESAKMTALGEMAGGVAHEINTPLAAIGFRVQLLQEMLQEDNISKEFFTSELGMIQEIVDRIAAIVSGLRYFAKEGRQQAIRSIKVSALIEATTSFCHEKFASRGVRLEVNKNEVYSTATVEGQQAELSQALLSLLSNASDAVAALPDKWVLIDVSESDEDVEISVTDSGTGIPQDLQQKIMEPFFTTKPIGSGTGLGLSVAKGITEEHGGNIIIDNRSRHTKFTMSIPKHRKSNSPWRSSI